MRSARQRFGWGALLIAASSCLGGQTGQPGLLDCRPNTVSPDQAIAGVTPNAFVAAFEGTHTTTLRWNAAGETAEDEITIVLLARTSPSALDACGQLEVTVDFALATRDHGLLESRTVTLSGDKGQLESASLYVQGERVRLSATLTAIDGEVQIAGTILTSDPALPSGEATFPAPE
jgi:hypothetical protein